MDNDVKSIAFPNISTGVYGYPKADAAKVAMQTVKEFLVDNTTIERVTFICFDDENYALHKDQL